MITPDEEKKPAEAENAPQAPLSPEAGTPSKSASLRAGSQEILPPPEQDASGSEKPPAEKIAPAAETPGHPLPIVGIGASAGGLEAFEKFFTNMPADSGMAFVLIQHLDPTHKSMLAELVKRYTAMNVYEVEDGMKVEANCIYTIPPNRDMALFRGRLQLMEPVAPRGARAPIDYFLRSLANDQGEYAIAVILSGTGSEGAQGVRTIKGAGGLVMIQDPGSARYDGMPLNAIATGLSDYILPPEEMPSTLVKYVEHAFGVGHKALEALSPKGEKDLMNKIFLLLRAQTGHDFSLYKQNTIRRRIGRRMILQHISSLSDYVRFLQRNPAEVETLFKEMLIGVTNFFRDPESWEALKEKVLPQLFEERPLDQAVRIWVVGCSTGEEAYTIAMLVQEYMEQHGVSYKLQIFATDIDGNGIEKARLGIFPEGIATDLTPERLQRFFDHKGNIYQVKRIIRDNVVFAVQNVAKDPPFSRLDLVCCRNLMIYIQPELQKQVLRIFHYALNQNGFLMLGNSETVGDYYTLFASLDRKWKIYQCKRATAPLGPGFDLKAPPVNVEEKNGPRPAALPQESTATLRALVERTLLNEYTPTCIVANAQGEVLYIHGRSGKYLELPSGETTLSLLDLAREGLRPELTNALRQANVHKQPVHYEGIRVKTNGDSVTVNLTVAPILEPPALRDLSMVILEEAISYECPAESGEDSAQEQDQRIIVLERELRAKEEYLQTTVEELETSNEELKSTNEEMQSSNEELQSTNEELETSKEELQSVNEELVTVNTELHKKIEQLSQANNDMNNLLASTEIGTIFLDTHLRIQRFTPIVTQIFPLLHSDIGRPVSDIATSLNYEGLAHDAEEVLNSLRFKEIEISAKDGRWLWMRIMPYRTLENIIDGVVITFVNITRQKQAQMELGRLSHAIEQSNSIVMITDVDGNIEYVNPRFAEVTGYTAEEVHGKNPRLLRSGEHPAEFYRRLWRTLLAGQTWRGEIHNKKKNGELFWEAASISPVQDGKGDNIHYVAVKEDITEQKRLQKSNEALLQISMDSFLQLDDKGSILQVNDIYCAMSGYSRAEALSMNFADVAVTPSPIGGVVERLKQLIGSGNGHFHLQHRQKDGRLLEVEASARYVNMDGGRVFVFMRPV